MAIREEVSGIGSMSKRTDLNVSQQPLQYIPDLPEGEGQVTYNNQRLAPMYAAPEPDVVSITAPTQNKNQPITSGADFGPGSGSEVVSLPKNTQPTVLSVLRQIAQNDPTGETDLIFQAMLERGLS